MLNLLSKGEIVIDEFERNIAFYEVRLPSIPSEKGFVGFSVRSKKERVISAGYDSVGFLRFDGDHDGLDRNHSPAL